MSDSEQGIECPVHGTTSGAYICSHLMNEPRQRWFCDYPSQDNPWPDAWCSACERVFQTEGEWNENNEDDVDIRLVCGRCYEEQKGSSVAPLMAEESGRWEPFVSNAIDELQAKQDRLQDRFDLSKHERWDYDQESGEIVFSNAGVPAVAARFQIVGSISTANDTWLWSWANFSLVPEISEQLVAVREFGEEEGFANLTVPKWPATEEDGWELTAVAAKALNADGAYRTPSEAGFLYLLLMDVRRVQ